MPWKLIVHFIVYQLVLNLSKIKYFYTKKNNWSESESTTTDESNLLYFNIKTKRKLERIILKWFYFTNLKNAVLPLKKKKKNAGLNWFVLHIICNRQISSMRLSMDLNFKTKIYENHSKLGSTDTIPTSIIKFN